MWERYLDSVVWLAAKLNQLANRIFLHAVRVELRRQESKDVKTKTTASKKQRKVTEPEPTVEAEMTTTTKPESSVFPPAPEVTLPTFTGMNGEVIPSSFDELPPYEIFRLMFERKYGRDGSCPMTIGGNAKLFTCDVLYELLTQIRKSKDADTTPMHWAVYGTVMSVILHAHGEPPIDKKLIN